MSAVHPRSRGEHVKSVCRAISISGSSPLARGTLREWERLDRIRRFIPARAGNTKVYCGCCRNRAVHPRSRGEHLAGSRETRTLGGSSPLARGTPPPRIAAPTAKRFIPARAGNTHGAHRGTSSQAVHPRSRGEHMTCARMRAENVGSSPLARGTRRTPSACPDGIRFIPARAGNTAFCQFATTNLPVHPRSRGEHQGSDRVTGSAIGSSPLARGTRHRSRSGTPASRFIPARAGNTLPRTY